MDSVMRVLAKKKTEWKEDLFLAVKLARQMISKYYSEVITTTRMLLISAHILNPSREFRSFRKWDKAMDVNPEDETFYTTQSQEAFLKYVENEYCTKHQGVLVNKFKNKQSGNLVPSTTASVSDQTSIDLYDSSSDVEDWLMPNNAAEKTPGLCNCAARVLTATRLYLNSPP
jgi:hypothetical protein